MGTILTDSQINALLKERKLLRASTIEKLTNPQKVIGRFKRATCKCDGKRFSITSYLGSARPNKFSVHVRFHPTGRGKPITLIRCNGFHAPHNNYLEKTKFAARRFHVHTLTERYQKSQFKDLGYAEETTKFHSFKSAIEFVCYSFGFYFKHHPYNEQYPLLRE